MLIRKTFDTYNYIVVNDLPHRRQFLNTGTAGTQERRRSRQDMKESREGC